SGGSSFQGFADGGTGDDTLNLTLMGSVSQGSLARLWASGGVGNDTLTLQATSNVDSGSSLGLNAYGGTGDDQITANYQGTLQGALSFRAEGGVGNDRIVATLQPAGGSERAASIYARVQGDSGNDDLRLLVLRPGSLPTSAIDAAIKGGLGRDAVRRTRNVRVRSGER